MASGGAVEPCEPWPASGLVTPASASRTCSARLTSQVVAASKIQGLTRAHRVNKRSSRWVNRPCAPSQDGRPVGAGRRPPETQGRTTSPRFGVTDC